MKTTGCLTFFTIVALARSGLGETGLKVGDWPSEASQGLYFAPPGESVEAQARRTAAEADMKPDFLEQLKPLVRGRWALWRHGYLVHVEGDFNTRSDVASLRKTWHALTVGAALQQGRIPSVSERISRWAPDVTARHAAATWWQVITQTSGFDYPYADYPAFKPGEMWTYSDKNPRVLCNALARVYGKNDFRDDYAAVLKQAYFDAIGLRGWHAVPNPDGIRLHLDLEDMGRLGLLVLARGQWNGLQLIPRPFVEQLERKQTDAIRVNYNGPDDGQIALDPAVFPEAPYGFMTWVNTDGDYYPGADRAWAWGAGAGGSCVFWNRHNGIVFAAFGAEADPSTNGIPHVLERSLLKANPISESDRRSDRGRARGDSQPAGTSNAPFRLGPCSKWQRIEIPLTGPPSQGRGAPNPFRVFVDASFTAPSGRQFTVPGFYDGDGGGGLDGNLWKVRFAADETGRWRFATTSSNALLNGVRGDFTVLSVPPDAPGLYRWGRLEAVGTAQNRIRYLKFRDGPYWLKAGCDDPENFLGQATHYDTNAKRIAAIDYLAGKGINSMYLMTHNLDGDDRDVWPWLGQTAKEAKANGSAGARFDVVRLAEWLEVFQHMQARGVVTYLVLEDDSAWKGYDHARYYRELVARFAHLPGLLFNFNEEFNENYTLHEALAFLQVLRRIDAYNHPRGIHNVNLPDNAYIDAPQIDFTAIQTGSPGRSDGGGLGHHQLALDWIQRCRERRQRTLMVGFDEGRPEEDRRAWWSAYLGGGVWEAHVRPPYDRPMNAWETVWTELGGTRAFLESLPFWGMEPANDVVKFGKAFCLAKPGDTYAFYLPEGGNIMVELPAEVRYTVAWWNPANGPDGQFQNQKPLQGGRQTLVAPGPGDWAARVFK